MALDIISTINLDLKRPNTETVYAVQYDTAGRIKAQLTNDGEVWHVPSSAGGMVSFRKSDNIGGFYDTTELGEVAVSVDENDDSVIYIALDAQTTITATPLDHPVQMQINFYNSQGKRLSTFAFYLRVQASVLFDGDQDERPVASEWTFRILTGALGQTIKNQEEAIKWMEDNIRTQAGYVVDDTLKVKGAAGDAKKIGELFEEIVKISDSMPGYFPTTDTARVGNTKYYTRENGGNVDIAFEYATGGYIRESKPGDLVPYSGWKHSDYIDISGNDGVLYCTMLDGKGSQTADGNHYNGFYDANKVYISAFRTLNGEVSIPDNAVYARVSCRDAYTQTVSICKTGISGTAPNYVYTEFTGATFATGVTYYEYSPWNRIWIDPDDNDVAIPTMEDIDDLNRQISDLDNALSVFENASIDDLNRQISDLDNALSVFENGGNVDIAFEYATGGYIRESKPGDLVPYSGWKHSDYIDISGNDGVLYCTMLDGKGSQTADGNHYNGFYDANKVYISAFRTLNGEVSIPDNAVYARVSCRDAYTQTVSICKTGIVDEVKNNKNIDNEYIAIATWNVGIFKDGTHKPTTEEAPDQIVKLRKTVGEMNADILNTQEYIDRVDASSTVPSANLLLFKYANKTNAGSNKCFSKFPIKSSETITFTSGSGRLCRAFTIDFHGKELTIINYHSSIERDPSVYREADAAQLITYMSGKTYCILTGDFNAASDAEYNQYANAGLTLCNGGMFGWFNTWPVMANMLEGFTTGWPCNHLDNIIVTSNIVPQNVVAVESAISDHAPLFAILRVD